MWFCPTFQRPEQLLMLADSWKKYEPDTPLYVRVWTGDPRLEDYRAIEWPATWVMYESETESFTAACNEFFSRNSDAEFYGFIADDVELTAAGSLSYLEAAADPFFISYPNDTIQRERMPTHYAIGGELVRTLGWFVPPFLEHLYTDNVLLELGKLCGLLRYSPHVVWYHKHPVVGRAAMDAGYEKFYATDMQMTTAAAKRDYESYTRYMAKAFAKDVQLVKSTLLYVENSILKGAGIGESVVSNHASEQLLPSGDVRRGVGGRDGTGSQEVTNGSAGGVLWNSAADDTVAPILSPDSKTGFGFPQGGCPWVTSKKAYKYEHAKLVVGVPSSGNWKSDMGASLALMTHDFMLNGLPGLASHTFHINSTVSSMLVSNRHNAVKNMMKVGGTHLLFIDSDMVFPAWLARRLMWHDVPIVAVNCTRRFFPLETTAKAAAGGPLTSVGKTGLEAVRQVGTGIIMIRRDVFEKIQPPYFMMEWVPDLQGYCGEDIYFCQLAQANGFEVLVDHDASPYVGHVGNFTFGHNQLGCTEPPNWMPNTVKVES